MAKPDETAKIAIDVLMQYAKLAALQEQAILLLIRGHEKLKQLEDTFKP